MSVRVPAGEMRHTVTIRQHKIERSTTAYDGYGQLSVSTTAWETISTQRARIEQLRGDEAVIAQKVNPRAGWKVTVDYLPTLDTTGGGRRAVVFGDKWLYIASVINPDAENRQLELLCGAEA